MRITIYKRAGSWCLDYRWNKRRFRYAVGDKRKTADEAAALIQAQVAAGTFKGPGAMQADAAPRMMTFGELCDEFLKLKGSNRLATIHFYETKIRNLRAWFGDKRPVASISVRDCDLYDADRRRKSSPGDANRHATVLKGLLKKAVDWECIDRNPAQHLGKAKEGILERFLTREEADRILEASEPWLRAVLLAFLHTGARRGDLCGDQYGRPVLMWTDVDLDRRIVTIRDPKEGTPRRVRINTDLHAVLNALPSRFQGQEVFLDHTGRPVKADRALRGFKLAAERAGIEDHASLRLHDLRHTAASWMVQAGIPIYEVKEVLGHKTLAMTQRYAHLAPEHLAQAVESLAVGTPWSHPENLSAPAQGTFRTPRARNRK